MNSKLPAAVARRFLPLILLLAAGGAVGQPATILDLALIPSGSQGLRRVYGATGQGRFGVPVAGGLDCEGDGFADMAVAYMTASPPLPGNRTGAGEIDLVFGDGTIGGGDLDTAVSSSAFLRIAGAEEREAAGSEIWIDDVTGDGLGDLLIGRQNHSLGGSRIGAGALTILAGGPALRAEAAKLGYLDLASPPAEVSLTTFVGARPFDRLGIWMRTGDVTGDGVADIVVGADQEDGSGEANQGAVYVIRGGSHLVGAGSVDLAGFGSTSLAGHLAKILPPPGAVGYHLGATCQVADLDGNGRGEVLAAATLFRAGAALSAPGAPPGSAQAAGGSPRGTVFIAWDDNFPEGPWPAGYTVSLGSAPGTVTRIDGGADHLHFGEELLGGLDFDGDGTAELFVGDLSGDGSAAGDQSLAGIGHVIYDAQSLKGLDFGMDAPPLGFRQTKLLGPSPGAIGGDTAAQGDFDGDGRWDLAVASPQAHPEGRAGAGFVHVLFGRPEGWPAQIDLSPGSLPGAAEVRIAQVNGARGTDGDDQGDTLSYSAAAGDMDGDGRDDLITNEMKGNGLAPQTVDVGNLLAISGAALAGKLLQPGSCIEDDETLCLQDGRFEVRMEWKTRAGSQGTGMARPLSGDTGTFWFFNPRNVEVVVKVLDACSGTGRFWVFAGGLTNVETRLRVRDVITGAAREYLNPQGAAFQPIQDTAAFETCAF